MLQDIAATIFLIIVVTALHGRSSRDNTDPKGGRSGLVLYTDAATGVQYVGTVMGGLTVRVDRDGKPFSKE